MFVDALRGVAAVAVVYDHVVQSSALAGVLSRVLPTVVTSSFLFGANGVQIFFVISGFVIAHSVRNFSMTRGEIFGFVVRRQLRLDPPYWAMIAISWVIWAAKRPFPRFHVDPIPGIGTVLANCLYVHRMFSLPEMVGVAWTLCIEIQFYLFFILLLQIASRFGRPRSDGTKAVEATIIAMTGMLAVATNPNVTFQAVWFFHACRILQAGF